MTILHHTVLCSSFPPHTKYWWHAVQVSLCGAGWSHGLVWSTSAGWRASAQVENPLVGHSACANPPLSAAFLPPPASSVWVLVTSAPQQPYLIERYSGSYPLRRELPPHGKDISCGYLFIANPTHVDTASTWETWIRICTTFLFLDVNTASMLEVGVMSTLFVTHDWKLEMLQ